MLLPFKTKLWAMSCLCQGYVETMALANLGDLAVHNF